MGSIWRWVHPKPLSDADFVERIRRRVSKLHRWRRWLVPLYAIVMLAWFGLLLAAGELMRKIGAGLIDDNNALVGFFIGIPIGVACGLGLLDGMHGFCNALNYPPRTLVLLLHYLDALAESVADGERRDSSPPVDEPYRQG